jgi:hypothetical protein
VYQPTKQTVPPYEIISLLVGATARIPQQVNGSFIVPYAYVPDCLVGVHIAGTVMLVGLLPSQQIALHADAPIKGMRYHVPLQTNNDCWCFSGGWQHLEVGKVYRMDPTQPHGAVNWGSEIRLHLMIDVEGVV